jgi:hypothetical protein
MLTSSFDANIRRRAIWWKNGIVSYVKPDTKDGWIYFPSLGEYECFIVLSEVFRDFGITVHPHLKTSSLHWVVDFRIEAKTNIQAELLAKLVNALTGCKFGVLAYFYAEFKGYADRNFRHKIYVLHNSSPILYNSLILLGKEDNTYRLKNGKEKSIYSLHKFKEISKIYIQ